MSRLGEHVVRPGRLSPGLGRLVSRMQRDREDADYATGAVFTGEEAAQMIGDREAFLAGARRLVAGGSGAGTTAQVSRTHSGGEQMFTRAHAVAAIVVTSALCAWSGPVHAQAALTLAVTQGSSPVHPGDIVLVTVAPSAPVAAVEGSAFGRPVRFWPGASSEWHGLVGVGLDTAAGRHEVTLRATGPAGQQATGTLALRVTAKQFETRRLKVEPQFVDPPAEEGPRIAREQERLAKTFLQVTERLWRGAFTAPVPGRATSSFGRLTVMNGQPRGRHQGADFSAATGTPIRAPNAGRVVLAADLYFSGNTVVLDHGGGLFSLFAHLSRIGVGEGAVVARGDRVGEVGATGRVTGPHLHWAVRLGELSVDPQSLMAAVATLTEATEAR